MLVLIETLRIAVYFIKESFNASSFPVASEYANSASEISHVYGQLFLLSEDYWPVRLNTNTFYKKRNFAGYYK